VLGAGSTGLAGAHRVVELAAEERLPMEVVVLEASSRVGGCIETRRVDGFTLEIGADAMLTDKPAAVALIERLGLRNDIEPMRAEFRGAGVVRGRRLVRIPPDFRLFTPTSMLPVFTSGLFGFGGALRAALEPFVPARFGEEDESVASFVRRRFGREVLVRLAQPLIGGIYSGDPRHLSMQATLPQLLEMEHRYGSVVRAARAAAHRPPSAHSSLPRLVGLSMGLGMLTQTLAARLGSSVRLRSAVTRCLWDPERSRWCIATGNETLEADAVLSALPAPRSAKRPGRSVAPGRPPPIAAGRGATAARPYAGLPS